MSKAERKLNVSTVLTVLHNAMAQLVFTIFLIFSKTAGQVLGLITSGVLHMPPKRL